MDQVKIIFESNEGTESLWATPVQNGFLLDNYPAYLKGVCFEDIVEAIVVTPGVYRYVKTLTKSGNSLYRLLYEDDKAARAGELLELMKDFGCSYEGMELDGETLLAINIPETTNADAVWNIMKTGLDEGTWEVQEGDDRHPFSDDGQP